MPNQHTGPSGVHSASPVPAQAGAGLRHVHYDDFMKPQPKVGWLEIHSENYLCPGGPRMAILEKLRRDYPLSCHGVGLSLGTAEGVDDDHLASLKILIDRFQPGLISEHVSWSVTDGVYLNDLMPLPYTEEALDTLCRNVERTQEALGCQILIENPSSYVAFADSQMTEWDFIAEAARRTGCGLLLDVNNIYVSAINHGFSATDFMNGVPGEAIGEIHVAGHLACEINGENLLIDDHGSTVIDPVWALLDDALSRFGPKPVLVEWDTNLPTFDVLLGEVVKAQSHLDRWDGRTNGKATEAASHVA